MFNSHTSLPLFSFFHYQFKLTVCGCTIPSAYCIIYSVLSARLGEIFLHEYIAVCWSKMEWFQRATELQGLTLYTWTALTASFFSLRYSCSEILSNLIGLCINSILCNSSVFPPCKLMTFLENLFHNQIHG